MEPTLTEEQKQIEDEIMTGLSNIVGHCHLLDGWTDSLFPYTKIISTVNPKIFPQMIKVRGEAKILIKMLTKDLIRIDEEAQDIMYEQLGKTISLMAMMSPEQRKLFGEKLDNLTVVLDNPEMTV
jgi:hypothetical protein